MLGFMRHSPIRRAFNLLKQIQPISTALDVPHRIDRH